jgi:DNA-nicking Smr family endonuclease
VNNPTVAEAIGVPRRTIQEKIMLAEAAENDPDIIFKSQTEVVRPQKTDSTSNEADKEKQTTEESNNPIEKEESQKSKLVLVENPTISNNNKSKATIVEETVLKSEYDRLKFNHWEFQDKVTSLQGIINQAHMELLNGNIEEAITILGRVSKYEYIQPDTAKQQA